MRLGTILAGIAVLVAAFVGATFVLQMLAPAGESRRPTLAEVPPLPAVSRTSTIVAPTVISLGAIREMLESMAPRNLTGSRDNPVSKLLSNAEIGWNVDRGPLGVFGKPDMIGVSTVLNGSLRATGQLSTQAAGGLGGAISGLLGRDVGRSVEKLAGRTLDQRTDIRGNVAMIAKPVVTPAWRLEPNLSTQFSLGDANMTILGARLNVSNEVRPLLERQVNDQVTRLQERLRSDPFLERVARREWTKLCRSIAIGGGGAAGLPSLWLELRPTRAIAAQPRVDSDAVTLLAGVEAETRIVPTETKPDCPFPENLEIIPQDQPGRVDIAVPIDMPFTELNRLLEAQVVGRTFPEDDSGAFTVTVRRVNVAASGERLLISLRVKVAERRSWFGLGTEADVYLWGRPELDTAAQVLRLTDVSLAVESEGVLGSAIRATAPYLQAALAERTTIDLKPFAVNARKSIEAAIADFRAAGEGVHVDAAIDDLRMTGIAFDATTLRIVAEADGTAKVLVTSLSK